MTEAEFNEAYHQYHRLVYNLALQYLPNNADAEDATQEVFVKLFHHSHRYQAEKASLKTWICRITIHHCLDVIRARKAAKRFGFLTALFQNDTPETSAHIFPHFDHPGVALENKEAMAHLFERIRRLPARQQTALILARIQQRPQQEVAEIMQISVKAVESLLQRAGQNLEKNKTSTKGKE